MSTLNKVVWGEGMFVRPQHFQQQERYVEHLISQQPSLLGNNRCGFTQLDINIEMLEQGKIALRSATGVLPDGTLFATRHDGLPTPVRIPEGINRSKLYLAVPLQQQGICDVAFDDKRSSRYRAEINNVINLVGDGEDAAEIQVGKLKLRLLLEEDDRSGFSCLQVAEIIEVRPDGKIILDKNFIPCVLDIAVNEQLASFVEEAHGLLQQRADVVADRLSRSQQSESAIVADFMLLQLVNRYEAVFLHFLRRSRLHPEQVFVEISKMVGELATFTRDSRRPEPHPIYDHQNLSASFKPIMQSARAALSMVLEQHAVAISLTEQSHGVHVAQVHDKELLEQSVIVLGVYAEVSQEALRQNFPRQIKIGPVTAIRDLVSRGIPGVGISPLPVAPRQIPQHANFTYFKVDQQHELWTELLKSGALALHIGANLPNLRLELWAIRT